MSIKANGTKLLFVTHLFYPAIGGVEVHLKHLSEGLVQRGYRVGVLTTDALSTEAFFLGDKRRVDLPKENVDGTEVERLGFRTFGARFLMSLTRLACRIKFPFNNRIRLLSFGPRNRDFVRRIEAFNPDIIVASPLPTMNVYYAHKAAQRLKKPLIIIPCYHIFDPCCFYNTIFFRMLRDADIVMAHSPMEKDYLSKEAGIPAERMDVVPPFPLRERQLLPPPVDKDSIRKRYGIAEKQIVLYMGQHGIHKKVNRVVEAMQYVWQRIDVKDAALVIAGGKTDHTAKLKARAETLQQDCGGSVYFIDNFPAEEKNDILRMSDIFISLSEMESFGIVFVEALNCGLPAIASRNCVSRYIVKEGETGILVEPRSITEVAGAVIELLSDDAMRRRFSDNARRSVKEHYHPHHILDKWEDVFANVIAHR
jgi:glycosyltransferase involved in cell wall biosynthesis